jgi:hypothetical protein
LASGLWHRLALQWSWLSMEGRLLWFDLLIWLRMMWITRLGTHTPVTATGQPVPLPLDDGAAAASASPVDADSVDGVADSATIPKTPATAAAAVKKFGRKLSAALHRHKRKGHKGDDKAVADNDSDADSDPTAAAAKAKAKAAADAKLSAEIDRHHHIASNTRWG